MVEDSVLFQQFKSIQITDVRPKVPHSCWTYNSSRLGVSDVTVISQHWHRLTFHSLYSIASFFPVNKDQKNSLFLSNRVWHVVQSWMTLSKSTKTHSCVWSVRRDYVHNPSTILSVYELHTDKRVWKVLLCSFSAFLVALVQYMVRDIGSFCEGKGQVARSEENGP